MLRSVVVLLVALAVASTATLPKANEEAKVEVQSNAASCSAGFKYYQGWCVHTTDPVMMTYNMAVDKCAQLNTFAPSIHSNKDVDFWSTYAGTELDKGDFWLDAYCANTGRTYIWRDGTRTNYAGPNEEFLDCQLTKGIHMQYNGLDKQSLTYQAPAVCVYDPLAKTTQAPTTVKATSPQPVYTSAQPLTTAVPFNQQAVDYCACNASSIYLDVVFVVDTSGQMAKLVVTGATSTIQAVLAELTLGTETFQTNVAALAYAESVRTVANFGDLKSAYDISSLSFPYLGGSSSKMTAAIKQASSMISANARNSTRGVIVLLTNNFNNADALNIKAAATEFENNGGVLITMDYSTGSIGGLQNIANPGYYINDAALDVNITSRAIDALCDANCFCRDGLVSINEPNSLGRALPDSCYHVSNSPTVYSAAEQMCNAQRGFVATVHDDTKSFFVTSLFPIKTPYWIGFERNSSSGVFEWADGSKDPYTNWAPGMPFGESGYDCTYGQQQTGFNSPWFSGVCNWPFEFSMLYACQLRPCSSEYDCSF